MDYTYDFLDDSNPPDPFKEFEYYHKSYLTDLNSYTATALKTYILLFDKKFEKLSSFSNCYELACKIGYGMLLRHCLEALSFCLAAENDIEIGEKTVDSILNELKESGSPDLSLEETQILFTALRMTNSIAHPNVSVYSLITFEVLKEFYNEEFKNLLEHHITATENAVAGGSIFNGLTRFEKRTNAYLLALKEHLDNFDIRNKIPCILTKGCLVRHLTECTVNYWCYKNRIVPTDESSADNKISISSNLTTLSQKIKENEYDASATNNLKMSTVSNLFELKNSSNCLMHIDSCSVRGIYKCEKIITRLHTIIISECLLDASSEKFNDPVISTHINKFKPSLITTLLCGIGGRFGLHHFYAGNYIKGTIVLLAYTMSFVARTSILLTLFGIINYWLQFLFLAGTLWVPIATIISLNSLKTGDFESSKWGTLPLTPAVKPLSILFMILNVIFFIW